MKHFLSAFLALPILLATSAFAAPLPPVIALPTSYIEQLRAFLGKLPHDEVANLINQMESCAAVQLPNAIDRGQCPQISQWLEQQKEKKQTKSSKHIAPPN